MSGYLNWWQVVGKSKPDQKNLALALVLRSFADERTGRLSKAARPLMRDIFGDENWNSICYAVQQMVASGLLVNKKPKGGSEGEWYLCLPKDIELEVPPNLALLATAQEIICRFGVDKVPEFIQVLKYLSEK